MPVTITGSVTAGTGVTQFPSVTEYASVSAGSTSGGADVLLLMSTGTALLMSGSSLLLMV